MTLATLLLICLSSPLLPTVFAHIPTAPYPWGKHTLAGWWNEHPSNNQRPNTTLDGYDYIVVGSGPGGAPLAARLGLAGFKVLVLEAGSDATPTDWNITVPYLNGKASEDPKISWSFFVNHYPDIADAARDPKYNYQLPNGSLYTGLAPPIGATPKGLFYPRTAAVGGCASHNALIMMYPLDDDWTRIVNLTGDTSWNATGMRSYYEKLENCQYLTPGTPGHGFSGWLATNRADPTIFLSDNKVFQMLKAAGSVVNQVINTVADLTTLLQRDLNAGSPSYATEQGLYNSPLCMDHYKRSSPRDFLVDTAIALSSSSGSGRIDIRTNCLATRVIFAPRTTRAIGVEFLDGQSLYRADLRAARNGSTGIPGVAFADREVILAGGAYNTPQLLKLSGIGPTAELDRYNIPQVVNLPGVGANLQDRYENSIIVNDTEAYTVFKGCTAGINSSDPCLQAWNTTRTNTTKYATNGRPIAIPMRSTNAPTPNNDLVITGRPGYFAGYFFGYSTIGGRFPNSWTWPVLKAHTQNRGGTVKLVSDDPRDAPNITFNYFQTGSGDWQYDLAAVVQGMKFAREILAAYATQTGKPPLKELLPGPGHETDGQLARYVQDTSWGHHASCSCPIGADGDDMAVLDSKLRVRGTLGLRVVDASVFPTIPGFYIQTSIFIVSEKAADMIIADAEKHRPSW